MWKGLCEGSEYASECIYFGYFGEQSIKLASCVRTQSRLPNIFKHYKNTSNEYSLI